MAHDQESRMPTPETPSSAAGMTAEMADRALRMRYEDLPAPALTMARHCLLDWLGVSLGARREPLVEMLVAAEVDQGGAPQAAVIGRADRLSTQQAALVNGAMGHALDYDDVAAGVGHPTAPVAPAILALGERLGASGAAVLCAFVAGYETEARVGRFMGPSHYDRGWHSTATFGTFGAAAAAAHLLDLSPVQTRHAFGIAGTQAAGLKSMFGTMCKPLHAGLAAQAGVRAALLAARGFTSNPEVLETPQGFGATQSERTNPAAALADPDRGFHILANLFKHHAACYLTHSTIEAIRALRLATPEAAQEVVAIRLAVAPGHLKVCNIPVARTGLECKFSIRTLAGLALLGEDTSDEALYSDATAARGDVARLRDLVQVEPTSQGTLAHVELQLRDGRRLQASKDVGVPETDLDQQGVRLEAKFRRLVGGAVDAEAVIAACSGLGDTPNLDRLITAVTLGA
jgi:2-methylcitrate dehydratase PrpD